MAGTLTGGRVTWACRFATLLGGMLASLASPSALGVLDGTELLPSLLSVEEGRIDLATAKLSIDKIIDPSISIEASLSLIDRMADTIRRMPGGSGNYRERLGTVRTYIYESGEWNDHRPYRYDLADPFGKNLQNKLLPNYMSRRLGNCVTMPILFIILADRMGIQATASTAPSHMFVKVTDEESGRTFNVETTSGAHAARDSWYREQMPMTEEALANGVYMRTLTKRETVAVMASVLLEHYLARKEPEKVIAIADAILAVYPSNAEALVNKGSAYSLIIDKEFRSKYPLPADIPVEQRATYVDLLEKNRTAFKRAESLGWREVIE